ncbi:hypothetical protein TWF506_005311 [Arthrobotrys conoides]|uniref:Phosphatidylinositol-specific phospholipase C X domain-containing protein n=1 Tax=Arthrobotrys conoides TaxID=74498 RepID=A0AAN8NJE9_9PEZI
MATNIDPELALALAEERKHMNDAGDAQSGSLSKEIQNSVLFQYRWVSMLMGAPIMIGALGGCFIASSAHIAATTKVQHPTTLQACLVECSNMGRYAFLQAEKGMHRISSLSDRMTTKITPAIMKCLGDTIDSKQHLPARVLMLQQASTECMNVAAEIELKFSEWLMYTCSLHVACDGELSVVAKKTEITKIQLEGEEARERAAKSNLEAASRQLEEFRTAVDESNGRLLDSYDQFPSGFEVVIGNEISKLKNTVNSVLKAPKKIFDFIMGDSKYCFDANKANNPDWMAQIDDKTNLGDLTMPGTHDTMTCAPQLEPMFAQCQNHNLATLLLAGVRYIDIRAWVKGDKLVVSHGPIPTGYQFHDVFAIVRTFLAGHPHENVIMRIREENPPEGSSLNLGEHLVRDYWRKPENRGVFSSVLDRVPTLGEVRGKIVLLQGFGAPEPMGLKWGDKSLMSIEDEYDWGIDQIGSKWSAAWNHIKHTKAGTTGNHGDTAGRLSLVHLSASKIPFLPRMFAAGPPCGGTGVNDHFGKALVNENSDLNQGSGRWGIIIMDFPGKVLINGIIDRAIKEHRNPNLGPVKERKEKSSLSGDAMIDSAMERVEAERDNFRQDHDNYTQQVEVVKESQRELGQIRVQLARLKDEELNLTVIKDVLIKSIALMIRMKAQITKLVRFFSSVATMISVVDKTSVQPLIEEITIAVGGNLNHIEGYSLDIFIRTAIFQAIVGINTYFGVFKDVADMWVQLAENYFDNGVSLAEELGDTALYLDDEDSPRVRAEMHDKAVKLDNWVDEAKKAVEKITTEKQNSIEEGMFKRIQGIMQNVPIIMPSREDVKAIQEAKAEGRGPPHVVITLTDDLL